MLSKVRPFVPVFSPAHLPHPPQSGFDVWTLARIAGHSSNFSQVFAGQAVGIKEVQDDSWLVSFMDYDLGYFDLDTRVLEPVENPFGPKV